jgi:secondary thiamine-phosphate synthase enzyme
VIRRIDIKTNSRVEFQEVTRAVRETVAASGVKSGVCHVLVPHTTAGVTVNEHADPSVVEDMKAQLDVMVPQHGGYRHAEGNSPAHIKASLMGSAATVLVESGEPVLGTWQGVFFCEFDGPRNRHMLIKVVADGD